MKIRPWIGCRIRIGRRLESACTQIVSQEVRTGTGSQRTVFNRQNCRNATMYDYYFPLS